MYVYTQIAIFEAVVAPVSGILFVTCTAGETEGLCVVVPINWRNGEWLFMRTVVAESCV